MIRMPARILVAVLPGIYFQVVIHGFHPDLLKSIKRSNVLFVSDACALKTSVAQNSFLTSLRLL